MRVLQTLREEHGWARQELGALAAVAPARVGAIENGRETPPRDSVVLRRLARALGIPEDRAGELADEVADREGE